jgi:hypothetical protein
MLPGQVGMKLTAGISTVLALAAFAVVAAPAPAGTPGPRTNLGKSKGLHYYKTGFPAVVSEAGADTACDLGDFATGGGATIAGDPAQAFLMASNAIGGVEGWAGRARTTDGGNETTYAICGGEEVDHPTSPGSRNAPFEIIEGLQCDSEDEDGLSSGLFLNGGDARISGLFREGSVFDGSMAYKVFTGASNTDATVNCSDDYRVRYRKTELEVAGNSAAKATVECKAAEAVAGGGFRTQVKQNGLQGFDAWAVQSRPVDTKSDKNKVPDDGWRAKVYNSTAPKHVLKVQATCVS